MLTCNCCGVRITPRNVDRDHLYKLGLFEEVSRDGQRAALRIGWAERAVCRDCTRRIERAQQRRRRQRLILARVVA